MTPNLEMTRLGMVLTNASEPGEADKPKLISVAAPEPGIYPDVPAHVYHRWDAASNSRLGLLKRSPAHMIAELMEPKDARHFALGRATHNAILEPDRFDGSYVVSSQCTGITAKKERCSNSGNILNNGLWFCGVHGKGMSSDARVTVLPQGDYDASLKMRDAVMSHYSASRLIGTAGQSELSCVWIDPETGVTCKARLDRHTTKITGGAIVDVKTTTDASKPAFHRAVWSFNYYRQAYFYLEAAKHCGLPAEYFVVVAVEKAAPWAVGVYRVIEAAIDAGEQEAKHLLRAYTECKKSGDYPAYSDHVEDITLPDYAWSQIETEAPTV